MNGFWGQITSSDAYKEAHVSKGQTATMPDIFQRLEQRHIDYAGVKKVVQFDTPQNTLFFVQWFKGRTIKQVLQQFEKWYEFLSTEFVLALSGELKSEVQQRLSTTEGIVVHALIEANPCVGPWDLKIELLPTGKTEKGPARRGPWCRRMGRSATTPTSRPSAARWLTLRPARRTTCSSAKDATRKLGTATSARRAAALLGFLLGNAEHGSIMPSGVRTNPVRRWTD